MTARPQLERTGFRTPGTPAGAGRLAFALLLAVLLAACDSGEPAPAGSKDAPTAQPVAPEKPPAPVVRPPVGDVSAVIGGMQRTWRLQAGQGTGQSGWKPLNPADSRVMMVGQAIGEHAGETEPLILEFTVKGTATRAEPANGLVRYGKLPGAEALVRLDSVAIRDQSLVLAGSFTARLPSEPGAAERRIEKGSFDATVYRLPQR